MAMAADPSVLLLDEPASGLSRGERDRLTELLAGLPEDMTLVLIEHDMDVALNTARRVVMMADGRIVASGSTEEIRNDPLVHEIYLGRGAGT
jgi:branched-chain amino acid transport system ATP-binding protein